MTTDQQEFVDQLVTIAEGWLRPLPADLPHMDPLPERLRGVVFGLLVNLEGNGGIEPHRLTPKDRPGVDLAERPLHEYWSSGTPIDPQVRELFGRFTHLVDRVEDSADRRQVMGAFVAGLCRVLEDGYELVPLYFDEHGQEVEQEGDDVAPGLTAAFQQAWSARRG